MCPFIEHRHPNARSPATLSVTTSFRKVMSINCEQLYYCNSVGCFLVLIYCSVDRQSVEQWPWSQSMWMSNGLNIRGTLTNQTLVHRWYESVLESPAFEPAVNPSLITWLDSRAPFFLSFTDHSLDAFLNLLGLRCSRTMLHVAAKGLWIGLHNMTRTT